MKHQRLLFQSFGSIERFDGMGESFALIPRNVCACVNNTLRLPASQNLGCDEENSCRWLNQSGKGKQRIPYAHAGIYTHHNVDALNKIAN